MENRNGVSFKRSYSDFEPFCKWRKDDERDILEIHLHDFRKENLKVQINNRGILTIKGENPSGGDRWNRFCKEIKVPNDCNLDGIRAKLSAGVLTVTMPKKSPPPVEKPPSVQDTKPQEHAELRQRKDSKKSDDDCNGKESYDNRKSGPRLLWRLKLSGKNFVKIVMILFVILVTFGTYVAFRKMCTKHEIKV